MKIVEILREAAKEYQGHPADLFSDAADEIEKRMADEAMNAARIDELKEALRPFAEAVIAADRKADKAGFARSFDQYSVDWKFTFGEMRRAAAVARASDGGEDE